MNNFIIAPREIFRVRGLLHCRVWPWRWSVEPRHPSPHLASKSRADTSALIRRRFFWKLRSDSAYRFDKIYLLSYRTLFGANWPLQYRRRVQVLLLLPEYKVAARRNYYRIFPFFFVFSAFWPSVFWVSSLSLSVPSGVIMSLLNPSPVW